MKILAVTNMYPTGATPALGTFVEQQIKGLREIGLDIEVLLLDRAIGGTSIYLRMNGRINERLRVGRFDLVHVMYGGVMAELVTRKARSVPSVITLHGSDLLGARLSPLAGRISAHIGVIASRRAARRAKGVVAVSTLLKDALPKDIDRSKVRVIPCGIDLERFRPEDPAACRRKLGWSTDSFHVLFATNGNPVKRLELAQRAVANLRRRGIAAEIHVMRGIPYDQVPTWINASDALIVTSLHEGSPTIVKECLACNVPVVSVDVGDVRERIDGIDGCAIVGANADELAAGMREVYLNRCRVKSRSRIEELSLHRTAEKLNDFYREVISTSKGHTNIPEKNAQWSLPSQECR